MTNRKLTATYLNDLLQNGTRQQVIEWLDWNDANGCYTDEDCKNEGLPLLSDDDARTILTNIITAEEII